MYWCPYTNLDLPEDAMNSEHIIPLSLGGSNEFCIPVEKEFNAKVGSKIDGALANDFLTLFRRREFDARGHSNLQPMVVLRNSRLVDDKRPIQVTLRGQESPLVWDAKARCYFPENEVASHTILSQVKIDIHARMRFLAKVSLSAGYFIYRELFRNCVRHDELRALMNFDSTSTREIFEGFGLRVYDEFSPIEEVDAEQKELDSLFCQLINGSCVIVGLGPMNVVFIVGVLGKWVGTLNVPAITESFPVEGEHDLGHVVILHNGKMTRISYRQLAEKAYSIIKKEFS